MRNSSDEDILAMPCNPSEDNGTGNVDPSQVSIMITRLRQERDEARRAVQFLNVEHASLRHTSQNTISALRSEARKSNLQRIELVLAIAAIRPRPGHRLLSPDGQSSPVSDAPIAPCAGCHRQELELAHKLDIFDPIHSPEPCPPSTSRPPCQETILTPVAANKPLSLSKSTSSCFASAHANQTTLVDPLASPSDLLPWDDCHMPSDSQANSHLMANESYAVDTLGDLTRQEPAAQSVFSVNNSISLNALQIQINHLNLTIAHLQKEALQNQDMLNARHEDLRIMESQLSSALIDASTRQTTLANLEDELGYLKTKVVQLQVRESELETNLANLKLQLEERKGVIPNLEAEVQGSVRVPSDELIQTRKTLQETQALVAELKDAQGANNSEMEELEKHCSTLCVQIQQKSDDLIQAELRLKTMQTAIERSNKEHELKQTELSGRLAGMFVKVAELEREKETDRVSFENQIHQAKASIPPQDVTQQVEVVQAELVKQRALAAAELASSERIKEERDVAFEAKIAELNARVEELGSENRSFADQLDERAKAEKENESARADLSGQLALANSQLTNLEREKQEACASFETTIRELSAALEELKSKQDKLGDPIELVNQADLEHERICEELLEQLAIVSAKLVYQSQEHEESCSTLNHENGQLKARVDELETEKRDFADRILLTTESSEAMKQATSENLAQARVELEILRASSDAQAAKHADTERELERLRLEIADLKIKQEASDELAKTFDALVVEFDLLQNKWQQSIDEADILRAKVEEYPRDKEALLYDIEDKEALIKSLKADLATVSKLHRNMPSLVELGEKITDLEAQLAIKTNEAEDAMDRLIDEMQKNKRLSNLVENLKVKIKSKDKAGLLVAKGEREQSTSAHEPIVPPPLPPSSANRKRKLDYVAVTSALSRTSSCSKLPSGTQENIASSHESSIPRKTILNPKLAISQDFDGTDARADSLPLQVRSVNQMGEEEANRNRPSSSVSKSSKSVSMTNAGLLANIQSLRKKQQQQAANSTQGESQNSIKRRA